MRLLSKYDSSNLRIPWEFSIRQAKFLESIKARVSAVQHIGIERKHRLKRDHFGKDGRLGFFPRQSVSANSGRGLKSARAAEGDQIILINAVAGHAHCADQQPVLI